MFSLYIKLTARGTNTKKPQKMPAARFPSIGAFFHPNSFLLIVDIILPP